MSATQQLLRFGIFELNLASGELRKSGVLVKLPPQSFKLLVFLANRAGQVVTREEIQKQLWGEETYVDFEHGVNKCVKQIRSALGDNADQPLYVETIPRYGYRFLAPVALKNVLPLAPQVKESNSGIESEITERVLTRTAASSGAARPSDPITAVNEATATQASEFPPLVKVKHESRIGARHWTLIVGLLIVAVAIAVGVPYWQSHGKLWTWNGRIVIADFRDRTSDLAFSNDALKQTLSSELRQSKLLYVLPETEVVDTLKLMSWPADTPLTRDVASAVCRRAGGRAWVVGTIYKEDRQYAVSLQATDCKSGQVLTREVAEVSPKEKVLDNLRKAATKLRPELAEAVQAASSSVIVPEGWYVAGNTPAGYEAGTDPGSVYNNHPSAFLRSKRSGNDGNGTLVQDFSADKYRGKRVRFSAFVKADGVQRAGLWMRIDKGFKPLAADNMYKRAITGTRNWEVYAIVLDVPQDATDISLGIRLNGSGEVWLNSVKFDVVGSDVPTTGGPVVEISDKPTNLTFEH